MFSQDVLQRRSSARFRQERQFAKQYLKNLKSGSSSCLCSTTLIGKYKECFFESWNGKRLRKEISVGTSVISPVLVKKRNGMKRKSYKPEGHPFFRASSALDRGFLKEKGGKCTIHFSAGPSNAEFLFRMINSANQLSIYEAIADWCHELTQQSLGQSFSSMEKSIANVSENFFWKLEPEEVNTLVHTHTHLRRMVKQREIDCVIAKRSSKIYQKRLGYLRFVNRLDSWGKSPLDYASEQFTAWMMVWEERQEHARSARYLEMTKILNLLGGFVDITRSVQFFKSELHVVLINVAMRYRYRLCREADLAPGLWYPEAHLATWMNLGTTKKTLLKHWDGEVCKQWAITRNDIKHRGNSCVAATGTIDVMKDSTKEFIHIDKRKWNDVLACVTVEKYSIAGKISNILTALVRHRDLDHREIDGAVYWSPFFPKLRRDCECEGARTFSESRWLGHFTQRKRIA